MCTYTHMCAILVRPSYPFLSTRLLRKELWLIASFASNILVLTVQLFAIKLIFMYEKEYVKNIYNKCNINNFCRVIFYSLIFVYK